MDVIKFDNTIRDSQKNKDDEVENVKASSPNQQAPRSMFDEVSKSHQGNPWCHLSGQHCEAVCLFWFLAIIETSGGVWGMMLPFVKEVNVG